MTREDVILVMVSAYNDWHIDEWAGSYPDRFIPIAILPTWNPEGMCAEIRRVAAECKQRREARQAEKARLNPTLLPLGLPAPAANGHANGKAGNGFTLDLSNGGNDAHDADFEQY